MIGQSSQQAPCGNVEDAPVAAGQAPATPDPEAKQTPREWGGREGPEPTRYGDWEKNGRCIDF